MNTVLFLHGFGSCGNTRLTDEMKERLSHYDVHSPNLPNSPYEAIALAEECIRESLTRSDSTFLVGVNLGGFYASYLSINYNLPALLVNPVHDASDFLKKAQGTHFNLLQRKTLTVDEHDVNGLVEMETLVNSTSFLNLPLTVGLCEDDLNFENASNYYHAKGAKSFNYSDCLNSASLLDVICPAIQEMVSHRK